MKKIKNKACLTIGFIFFNIIIFAQNQKIADSLIWVYKNAMLNDTAKFDCLSDIAFYSTNPGTKLYYSELLIGFAKKKQNSLYMFKGYYIKGIALKLQGKLEEASKSFFLSAKFAGDSKNTRGVGITNIELGDIYRILGNHQNSIFFFNKAINAFRSQNDSLSLASALLNIGNEYLVTNKLDTALTFFNEADGIFAKIKYKSGIAYCNGSIGRIYSLMGNITLAEEKLDYAINILKELKDNYALASFQIRLAVIYQQQGKTNKAIQTATNSLEIASRNGLVAQMRDACKELADIYSLEKDYKNAYHFQSKYIAYRDSVNNEETIRKIADLRTEYEVAQKQSEVDLLVKKRKVTQIVTFSVVIIAVLALVFLFILYRNYCRKKALNKLLLEQQEELKAQQEQLESLNRTKDRFFSIISHDLRGPISSIGGLPVLLKESIAQNQINELSELITHMDTSMQQVSNLLDNLLEWALSQQGTFPYRPDNILLNQAISEVYSIFSSMAEAKGIRMVEDVQGEIYVCADKNSLMTIIRNLISNAIKFTPKGGTIFIIAKKEEGFVSLTIKDTGIGMPKDKLQTLFHLNEKKSTWGTNREKGLGIGLCLVNDFVIMNNGTIKVESEEGKGTSFIISIPQV